MTKHFDHDGTDPLDSPLAGMLTEAMSSRHHQLRTSDGSLHDVRMRARRITRRRTAVGAGALVAVGAVGAIAVASRNGDGGDGQRIAVGSNGEPNDAAGPGGSDGGYWECTGPLGSTGDPAILSSDDYRQLIDIAAGVSTIAPFPGPTTTWVVNDTTSTMPSYVTTTVVPDESHATSTTTVPITVPPFDPTTTFPFDPTSTTVDLSASTSTVDPGLATATSYIANPIPVPIDNGGVFYMQNCTHVDGPFTDATVVPADPPITYPAGLETATTVLATGTGVADTLPAGLPADDSAAGDPTVDTTIVATTTPGG